MEFANALMDRAIEKSVTISHLKLQKLAYYCQGLHLAMHDTPIFTEEFEAWRHGPLSSETFPSKVLGGSHYSSQS